MSWVAVAIGGSAVLAGVMSNQSRISSERAGRNANELQSSMFDTVRGDTAAQREIGTNALNKLADILGIERSFSRSAPTKDQFTTEGTRAPGLWGPDTPTIGGISHGQVDPIDEGIRDQIRRNIGRSRNRGGGEQQATFDAAGYNAALADYTKAKTEFDNRPRGMDAFTPDPGYQFRLDTTNKAVDRYQSSGRVTGGRAIKEAQRYGQDFASNEFGNATGRLFTLAGYGPVGANTSAQAGINAANQGGQYQLGIGNAQNNNYANMNNVLQGAAQNYTTYRTYQDWSNRLNQNSGGSGSMNYDSSPFTYDSPT